MAGEIIRQGDPTSHGGKVLEGSLTDICHGKPIAYVGHKVQCPKCKGIFPIVEGALTITFYGKGVALAGMKTACGASLIATQFTDIVEYGGGGGQAEAGPNFTPSPSESSSPAAVPSDEHAADDRGTAAKSVTRLFWTYGPDETALDGVSRHYVDLNLHIETENFRPGESVNIVVKNDDGSDLLSDVQALRLKAVVGSDGKAKLMNVLRNKTVELGETR